MSLKIRTMLNSVVGTIEKRPWIPMAIYLGVFALFVLVAWIPLANLIYSQWRPMPELSASAKLTLEEVVSWIYKLLQVSGAISVLVVPFAMLCALRFRSAFYSFLYNKNSISKNQ